MDEQQFDYVIVGAGSAGCVLASRLSADPNRRVALVEAGGDDRRFWVRTPIGYGKCYYDERVNWCFRSATEAALGGREVYFPRGKILGGSSSINAMVYSHGMPADYDDWRAAGNPGWGWSEAAAAFARIERRVDATGRISGDGPLWVSDREAELHPVKRHFYAAAQELQLKRSDDVNGPDPEGVGGYQLTTMNGQRCSAAVAFLRPALVRRNLALFTAPRAERGRSAGAPAGAVAARRGDGAPLTLKARGAVILAAGAVASPQLLQLSGVGPGDRLQTLGVDPIHVNPAVGGALQDHLGIVYFYRATEPTLNRALGSWFGRMAAGAQYLVTRRGPLSLSVNQLGGMVRSTPDKERPDVQLYFNPVSYSITRVGERDLLKPDAHQGFVLGHNSCRPTSVGRVDAASPDPAAAPMIRPNYLSTEKDVADVVAAARLIGRLQETTALRGLIAAEPPFDPARADDEAIVEDFRARSGSVYHPCGTCRMAPEAEGGVVDARLRVYGTEGLRVVDASIFPNITSANINAPTLMAAERGADIILADEKGAAA